MNKKYALVTGANRGIGHEIVRQLAGAGFTVYLAARDEAKAREAALPLGPEVHPRRMDVSDEASVRDLAELLSNQIPRLDVLINNAAIMDRSHTQDFDLAAMRATFETNFWGPILTSKYFMPLLQQSDDPRIINISSEMGLHANLLGRYAGYRLTKAGLNNFTRMLAAETAGTKLKVVAMCPGWVQSDMGGPNAARTLAQGADTAVWLATTPTIQTGCFYQDRQATPW